LFLGLLDLEPDPSIINLAKIVIKTLFLLFCDFFIIILSLKINVNVASKSNKQKNRLGKKSFVAILKVTDKITGSGSGSVSQRRGSGSGPKCHGSAKKAPT
jgi:hypothetical protein